MPKEGRKTHYYWIAIFILAIALKIYFVYFGYLHENYIVPPGSDVIEHLKIINSLTTVGANIKAYPPGFHYLIIFLSKIFSRDVFYFLTYWTPILIILPTLTIFFLLRQLFSLRVSVITASILLLTSNFPLYAFVDGNYPDMLAYGFLAVLLFAFLIRYFKSKKWWNLVVCGALLLLIALTHHLTFISIFAILVLFGLVQLYILFIVSKVKPSAKYAISGIIILGVSIAIFFLASQIYGNVISNFIGSLFKNNSAINDSYLSKPLEYIDYPKTAGDFVWYVGLFGFLYLALSSFNNRLESKTKQLVVIWFLFYYILSRLDASGLPARFARELALPLIVGIGFLVNFILEQNPYKKPISLYLGYGLIGYIIIINSSLYTGLGQLPKTFNDAVWFWPKDQEKLDYLEKNIPSNKQVLYNPNANLFVSIKAKNSLRPIKLSNTEQKTVEKFMENPKDKTLKSAYNEIIEKYKQEYKNIQYIFIDIKPPSDPSEITYRKYYGYNLNNRVLNSIGSSGKIIKKFSDNSILIKMY